MIRESLELYNRHLIKILLLSVLFVIPLTLFCYVATYYLFDQLTSEQHPNLYALFLIVINFVLVIPSFMKLALTDIEDDELPSVGQLIYEGLRYFGLILFLTIPFYIVGVLGSAFFFIPTILCFAIILLIPFFVKQKTVGDVFRQVGKTLRNENIFLLLDLLVIVSVQILVWGLLMIIFANFENNFYVYGLARSMMNSFIFPLLVFYFTIKYRKSELSL
ncbi:hypothetical protein [Salinibacillus xinjiangensis]|nr:hypothetical protein [Salinibacillus xinjiangensis]